MRVNDLLGAEWAALHGDCERAERSALAIKLLAVVLCAAALAFSQDAMLAMLLLAVLWLQEAIVRTGQARLTLRLLHVEALLRQATPAIGQACQLYSEWTAGRAGGLQLVGEYLSQAWRPTVAFPHVLLLALLAIETVG